MNTILVPTDFSEAATAALDYACEANKKWNASIILFHSYDVLTVTSEDQQKAGRPGALDNLKQRYEQLYSGMKFSIKSTHGLAPEQIAEEEKNDAVDLIVMGVKDDGGIRNILSGSIPATVIEKSSCPVLVIPEKNNSKTISKILYATDFHESDLTALVFLITVAKKFHAAIYIVHVSQIPLESDFESKSLAWFKDKLRAKHDMNYEKLSFDLCIGGDPGTELNSFIEENNIDLISLSMRKRNAFSKFFERSLTKKLVNHSRIPLLAFHAN